MGFFSTWLQKLHETFIETQYWKLMLEGFGRLSAIFAYCVCDQPPFATRKLSASSDWSRSSGVFPSSGRSSHIVPLPSIGRPIAEKPSP